MKPRLTPQLSEADLKRMERVQNKRTRRQQLEALGKRRRPSKVPARLARTSAFAAKRHGLIDSANFERSYRVPGHSFVVVKGRELGTQHRDALYAVFRLPAQKVSVKQTHDTTGQTYYMDFMVVDTSWRDLLTALGLTHHANNSAALKFIFGEIKQVVVTVHEGDDARNEQLYQERRLLEGAGRIGNLLHDIEWSGIKLDDRVRITYGDWTAKMVTSAKLVSLNADVQFALQSDYAKCIWPYIDSMTKHDWVDEDMLAYLVGRGDLWGPLEDSHSRGEFRKLCRRAFNDMVRVGGLTSWHVEILGSGRKKKHRYYHVHALRRAGQQLELPMLAALDEEAPPPVPLDIAKLLLSPETYEKARRVAPGFDVRALEGRWHEWLRKADKGMPDNADLAFLGFCRKHAAAENPRKSIDELVAHASDRWEAR